MSKSEHKRARKNECRGGLFERGPKTIGWISSFSPCVWLKPLKPKPFFTTAIRAAPEATKKQKRTNIHVFIHHFSSHFRDKERGSIDSCQTTHQYLTEKKLFDRRMDYFFLISCMQSLKHCNLVRFPRTLNRISSRSSSNGIIAAYFDADSPHKRLFVGPRLLPIRE